MFLCFPCAHSPNHRPEAAAAVEDISRLQDTMLQVTEMEKELAALGGAVSGRSIELKGSIKKKLSSPAFLKLLNKLEINNEPVWGLTQDERSLVKSAREKSRTC